MGNTNLKEISIRSFEPNISNMTFNLNDDSVLIPLISNTINRLFIDNLNKSTNLNLYNPNLQINENNLILNQQIKFTQMLGDCIDVNTNTYMENEYTSEEENLFNNILNKNKNKVETIKIYQKKNNIKDIRNNNESSINNSIGNISSINNKNGINESKTSDTSINQSMNNNQNNKQIKVVKIGKKTDFQPPNPNKPFTRPESKNSSNNSQKINLSLEENNIHQKKGKIYISKQVHKKSISPPQNNIKNYIIPTICLPRKVRSIEKKNINENNSGNILIKKIIHLVKKILFILLLEIRHMIFYKIQ